MPAELRCTGWMQVWRPRSKCAVSYRRRFLARHSLVILIRQSSGA